MLYNIILKYFSILTFFHTTTYFPLKNYAPNIAINFMHKIHKKYMDSNETIEFFTIFAEIIQ